MLTFLSTVAVIATDIATPIKAEIAKPLFDAAPYIIGIVAIIYLVKQAQNHREGIGLLIAETGIFAGALLGVLKVIQTVTGVGN